MVVVELAVVEVVMMMVVVVVVVVVVGEGEGVLADVLFAYRLFGGRGLSASWRKVTGLLSCRR